MTWVERRIATFSPGPTSWSWQPNGWPCWEKLGMRPKRWPSAEMCWRGSHSPGQFWGEWDELSQAKYLSCLLIRRGSWTELGVLWRVIRGRRVWGTTNGVRGKVSEAGGRSFAWGSIESIYWNEVAGFNSKYSCLMWIENVARLVSLLTGCPSLSPRVEVRIWRKSWSLLENDH